MRPVTFTRNWKATREMARETDAAKYLPINVVLSDDIFEIARWSRFSEKHDDGKVDLYLPVPTADFGEALPEMLDHTTKTGIGKIVTFRDAPRYVLDPGGRWRSYQATRFGVPRGRYLEAIRGSRIVQRLLEKQNAELRKETLSLKARLEAAEEALKDLEVDYAAQEEEVRHLRRELARQGQ